MKKMKLVWILLTVFSTASMSAQDLMVKAFHDGKIVKLPYVHTPNGVIIGYHKKNNLKLKSYIDLIKYFENQGYELMFPPAMTDGTAVRFWFKKEEK